MSRPFFNIHQIETGKYTAGGQYVLEDGSDYEGLYHLLPNGQRWTGFKPSNDSNQLFIKRIDAHESVITYNNLVDDSVKAFNYMSPKFFSPTPELGDYDDGFIFRYFVQKLSAPLTTIMEIDVDQFNSINRKNKKGINGFIWRGIEIEWVIVGNDAAEINERTVNRIDRKSFKALGRYIDTYSKFVR